MKALTKTRAAKKVCRRCGNRITWARTEATDRTVRIDQVDEEPGALGLEDGFYPEDMGIADLVLTGETRMTARGKVPVVRYVREGTGTHIVHVCG